MTAKLGLTKEYCSLDTESLLIFVSQLLLLYKCSSGLVVTKATAYTEEEGGAEVNNCSENSRAEKINVGGRVHAKEN